MPSFGGRIGRHIGEAVSSSSDSTPGGPKTAAARPEEKTLQKSRAIGDSGAPRHGLLHSARRQPHLQSSSPQTKREAEDKRVSFRMYGKQGGRRGILGKQGGIRPGSFYGGSSRVEKTYISRPSRASRRSSPDTVAQLTPTNGYLKYHEITLLYSDIRALKDDWLTDTNIAFWEEYIEHEILPKYPQARIALMRPSLVALMVQAQRLKDIEGALPEFKHETHIFLPISDSINAGRRADTGSHWSLLLVSKLDGVAFHYDSMNDHNDLPARAAVDRLSRHLRQPLRFYRILEMPQQTNSSDCGVIVCILMRHLLVKKLLNANAREKVAMSLAGKQIDAHGGRKEMLKTIEQLRKEGERRRSTGALPLTIRSGNSPPYID